MTPLEPQDLIGFVGADHGPKGNEAGPFPLLYVYTNLEQPLVSYRWQVDNGIAVRWKPRTYGPPVPVGTMVLVPLGGGHTRTHSPGDPRPWRGAP